VERGVFSVTDFAKKKIRQIEDGNLENSMEEAGEEEIQGVQGEAEGEGAEEDNEKDGDLLEQKGDEEYVGGNEVVFENDGFVVEDIDADEEDQELESK
jgi:predicted XRE-type DNA-binding protein